MTIKQLQEVFKNNSIPDDVEIFTESWYNNETHEIVYIPSENCVYICDSSEMLVEDIIESYAGIGWSVPEYLVIKVKVF